MSEITDPAPQDPSRSAHAGQTRSKRPDRVTGAAMLWGLYLFFDAVNAAFGLASEASQGWSLQNESMAQFHVGALVADGLMFILLLAMFSGQNWSRIILALCGAARFTIGLPVLIMAPSFSLAIAAPLLLVAVATVTMFAPTANEWFRTGGNSQSGLYCPHCGKRKDTGASFCGDCGSKL